MKLIPSYPIHARTRISSRAALLVVFLFSQILGNQPSLKLIYPARGQKIVHAPGAYIKGMVTSSSSGTLQLLIRAAVREQIDVSNPDAKQNFPSVIRNLWPDNFILETIQVKVGEYDGDTKILSYQFTAQDQVDLRKFWGLVEFRKILARVYDQSSSAADVHLSGYISNNRSLNLDEMRNHKDIFAFAHQLRPGRNTFYLQILDNKGENVLTDSVALFYKIEPLDESAGSGYVRYQFHTADNERGCAACHGAMEEDNCLKCHQPIIGYQYTHPPTEEEGCSSCHDYESSPRNQTISDMYSDIEPCLMCHSDQEDALSSMDLVHPPFEEGCVFCHDSHSSPNGAMLVRPVIDVCGYCHDDIIGTNHPVANHPLEGEHDPLRTGRRFSCASCHDPHASNEASLLRESWFTLCSKCHQK
ncbi:cytochrome c3 family protein [Candidatus Neomarinimicrobiota bacterium]